MDGMRASFLVPKLHFGTQLFMKTLYAMTVSFGKECNIQKIPTPRKQSQQLLASLEVQLPSVLPVRNLNVATKRKLQTKRK